MNERSIEVFLFYIQKNNDKILTLFIYCVILSVILRNFCCARMATTAQPLLRQQRPKEGTMSDLVNSLSERGYVLQSGDNGSVLVSSFLEELGWIRQALELTDMESLDQTSQTICQILSRHLNAADQEVVSYLELKVSKSEKERFNSFC